LLYQVEDVEDVEFLMKRFEIEEYFDLEKDLQNRKDKYRELILQYHPVTKLS
jgi:hypothetical protein